MHRLFLTLRLLWPCALLLIAAQGEALAAEPQVWRCGNTYSYQPCAQGVAVDTQDGRTAQQQRQAKMQAEQTRAFADALHRENTAREAQQRKEEMAWQKALLRQQAALQQAQRRAQAMHNHSVWRRRNQRPVGARRVWQPTRHPTAPASQR